MTARAWFDAIIQAIGELARPLAILMVGYATAWAIHQVSLKVQDGNDGAIFLGAVSVILLGVVGVRAVENINAVRQAAKVDIAKAENAPVDPMATP